ncbi:MAG: hypothetical protein GY757_13025 [bacterium]|nr:hypothetical protein [bacterium]
MRFLKIGLLISLLLSVSLMFGAVFPGATQPPAEALKAAQKGLTAFIALNDGSKNEQVFNVLSHEELKHAVVDFGFLMHTINPEVLRNPGNKMLSSMVEPTPLWRFSVLSKGKAVGLITVTQVNGQWEAVGAGAAELAAEVHSVRKAWPATSGFDIRFVRVYQATADFMEVVHKDAVVGYVPMKAARVSLDMGQMELKTDNLLAESELMEPLREQAMRNMKDFLKPALDEEQK